MNCSECKNEIPSDRTIFVIPEDVDYSMTGKHTKRKILCFGCSPASRIGCHFSTVKEELERT
jgi:hypothetical protein